MSQATTTATTTGTIASDHTAGRSDSVSATSIAIWLTVQLVAIALIISRVHIWIDAGDDADALIVMLIAQMACASIFAPALMRNVRTAVCVALSALPFLHIAGAIASVETRATGWRGNRGTHLADRAVDRDAYCRTPVMRGVMHAIVNCISIGGVIVYYLRTEFGNADRAVSFEWCGPIAAGVTLASRASSADSLTCAWIALGAVALVFLAAMILNRMILVARAPARLIRCLCAFTQRVRKANANRDGDRLSTFFPRTLRALRDVWRTFDQICTNFSNSSFSVWQKWESVVHIPRSPNRCGIEALWNTRYSPENTNYQSTRRVVCSSQRTSEK